MWSITGMYMYMWIQISKTCTCEFKFSDPIVRSSSKFMYRAFRTWRIDCEYSRLPVTTPSYCSSIRILTHVHVFSKSLFPLSNLIQNWLTGHFAHGESIASTREHMWPLLRIVLTFEYLHMYMFFIKESPPSEFEPLTFQLAAECTTEACYGKFQKMYHSYTTNDVMLFLVWRTLW